MSQQLESSQPYLIQARAAYSCRYCGQPLKSVFRPPDNTSRWLLGVIALILTPFLIGIFLWIAYNRNVKQEQSLTWWHCESCGWKTAVRTDASGRPLQPYPKWFRITAASALLALIGIAVWGSLSNPKPVPTQATPTPTVQKAEPRKATRGQRR